MAEVRAPRPRSSNSRAYSVVRELQSPDTVPAGGQSSAPPESGTQGCRPMRPEAKGRGSPCRSSRRRWGVSNSARRRAAYRRVSRGLVVRVQPLGLGSSHTRVGLSGSGHSPTAPPRWLPARRPEIRERRPARLVTAKLSLQPARAEHQSSSSAPRRGPSPARTSVIRIPGRAARSSNGERTRG